MITKQIILRYRAPGHVRFQLPAVVCQMGAGERLVGVLNKIDGVYRVDLYRRRCKLSIRYHEAFCRFEQIARVLHQTISELERAGKLKPVAVASTSRAMPLMQIRQSTPVQWAREKVRDIKETVAALGILLRQGLKRGPKLFQDPKKLAFEFANDVLVLYLIKVHWHRIVNHWIVHPIKYRYEWAAIFYLTYLLIRSRLPKK